jgi:hypothetical protein
VGLDAALDRFWEAAEARGLGIDPIEVVADNGPHGERRRIDDIRRDVFSVSRTSRVRQRHGALLGINHFLDCVGRGTPRGSVPPAVRRR